MSASDSSPSRRQARETSRAARMASSSFSIQLAPTPPTGIFSRPSSSDAPAGLSGSRTERTPPIPACVREGATGVSQKGKEERVRGPKEHGPLLRPRSCAEGAPGSPRPLRARASNVPSSCGHLYVPRLPVARPSSCSA